MMNMTRWTTMSKLKYLHALTESIVNDNCDILADYQYSLPHDEQICKEICDDFNKAHIERFFDGILKDKIKSCRMRCIKDEETTLAIIDIEGIEGFRMSQKRRNAVWEQMEGQMCDGWGEGFFGFGNVMKASDGTQFIVE